jgi:hypothetical protein
LYQLFFFDEKLEARAVSGTYVEVCHEAYTSSLFTFSCSTLMLKAIDELLLFFMTREFDALVIGIQRAAPSSALRVKINLMIEAEL